MKFKAEVTVMPHKEILDPQGKAVKQSLHNLEMNGIEDVRIGKHIDIELETESEAKAKEMVENACKNLLANLVMESYSFDLKKV